MGTCLRRGSPSKILAWIALEDIEEDGGRFYVIPQTHKTVMHESGMPHSVWLVRMKEYGDTHADKVFAPELKKGDVVFWNSSDHPRLTSYQGFEIFAQVDDRPLYAI
jgi:ectoine hydroxylase-related dioxygenase (phytanoyl-CoA dioxygenase family)